MNNTYIGTGINPDGTDLPLGFGMQLAQNADAMNAFAILPQNEKNKIIEYIQNGDDGNDAKHRITSAVDNLTKFGRFS